MPSPENSEYDQRQLRLVSPLALVALAVRHHMLIRIALLACLVSSLGLYNESAESR